MLCKETSTSLGFLQKYEGATGEFKGAKGSQHPIISSPAHVWLTEIFLLGSYLSEVCEVFFISKEAYCSVLTGIYLVKANTNSKTITGHFLPGCSVLDTAITLQNLYNER